MEVALDDGGFNQLWFFITHPRIALTVLTAFKKCANLLEVPYFSQTAYLLGERAVHYWTSAHANLRLVRCRGKKRQTFFGKRLIKDLAEDDAYFDFEIQFQTDAKKMPIEDANVAWKEKLSPYRKVATIKIPAQSCLLPGARGVRRKRVLQCMAYFAGAPAIRGHQPGAQRSLPGDFAVSTSSE